MQQHPSFRLMNQSLTYWGCDREIFTYGMLAGAFMYLVNHSSILIGLTTFGLFLAFGRAQAHNKIYLRSLISFRFKKQYDAALRQPYYVEVIRQEND